MKIQEALRKLLALNGDYSELVSETRKSFRGVNSPAKHSIPVLLKSSDIDHALRLYIEGSLSERQIQEWADILEMNEYVEYENGAEEVIANVLFRLTTPEINSQICTSLAQDLLSTLASRE